MPPTRTKLEIEKLVYGGDGLARLPADAQGRRMAVFVPFTLPGEQVEAAVMLQKGGMARAELQLVAQPSSERVAPACPYFGTCGGCHLQHGSYELQLRAKRDVLRETLDRARLNIPVEIQTVAAAPWNYRNRIRLHARTHPAWQVGYLERRSHRFLPVAECPVAAPLLQRALTVLVQTEIAALAPAGTAEVELFCNQDESELTLHAMVKAPPQEFAQAFSAWIAALQVEIPELRGGVATMERSPGEASGTVASVGEAWINYRAGAESYRVSATAFFQVNLHLLDALAELVVTAVPSIHEGEIFDLYAGAGLFSVPLARAGARVTAVESAPASSTDLATNLLGFPQAKAVAQTTERFLAKVADRPAAILVDPPRAGLGPDVTQQLARLSAPALIYLSCDPTTLARDLQALLAHGYVAEKVTMIDLFPHTFHLETLVVLRHN
jgi:23S rRNA (uracil1939-C5)-methyltransferase